MMASEMANQARKVLRGAVTAVFLFYAFLLLRDPQSFAVFGYPTAFAIFIAVADVCGAIGVWIPKVARFAALGLILIMIGAAMTLVRAGETRQGTIPLIVLLALTRLALSEKPPKIVVPDKPLGIDSDG